MRIVYTVLVCKIVSMDEISTTRNRYVCTGQNNNEKENA